MSLMKILCILSVGKGIQAIRLISGGLHGTNIRYLYVGPILSLLTL